MKVAMWRYGLPYQHAGNSTVGGGLIAEAVTTAIAESHDLHLVGKASKDVEAIVQGDDRFSGYHPDADDLTGFDAAVILTGPANGLYPGYANTYRLLDGFKGRAIYCQWDCALPFNFAPKPVKGVEMPHPSYAKWTLLTQVPKTRLPERAAPDGVNAVQCFFELCEMDMPWLQARKVAKVIPRIGYFGGDRPGRLKELQRWAQADVPIDIYGRWSDKSKAKLQRLNVTFKDPVSEGTVHSLLNSYAMTLYIADGAYVRQDFLAQRVLENARAGVPVVYSDFLQPSVKRMLISTGNLGMMVRTPHELRAKFEAILSLTDRTRKALVEKHQTMVGDIRKWKGGYSIEEAFAKVLP